MAQGIAKKMLSLCDTLSQESTDSSSSSLSLRVLYGCIVQCCKKTLKKTPACAFRTNVMKMHNSLSWLTVVAKVTSSLVMFAQNAVVDRKPEFLSRLVRKGCFDLPQPKQVN